MKVFPTLPHQTYHRTPEIALFSAYHHVESSHLIPPSIKSNCRLKIFPGSAHKRSLSQTSIRGTDCICARINIWLCFYAPSVHVLMHKQSCSVPSIHPAIVVDNTITSNGYFEIVRRKESRVIVYHYVPSNVIAIIKTLQYIWHRCQYS